MTCNLWVRKALSSCLMVAVIATYSMVVLAVPGKVAGDLTVIGKGANSSAASVLINGESAKSGRSVFTSSTIATPADSSAVISLGKLGKIQVAPNSTFTLNFENAITGTLTSGKVTVLTSADTVAVTTANGVVNLAGGEAVTAAGSKAQDDDDDDDGGAAWWLFAIGMGGALAGIIWAATSNSNEINLGGGGTVVSPVL